MRKKFIKNNQSFLVKDCHEKINQDEIIIKFENRKQIESFFNSAMRDKGVSINTIPQIASVCIPTHRKRNSNMRLISVHNQHHPIVNNSISVNHCHKSAVLDQFYSEIYNENLNIVVKKGQAEKNDSSQNHSIGQKSLIFIFDLADLIRDSSKEIKKFCSKVANTHDFHIFEQVYNYEKNNKTHGMIVIDPNSVKEHTTDWTGWDNTIEWAAWAAFKGIVTDMTAGPLLSKMKSGPILRTLTGGTAVAGDAVAAEYRIKMKTVLAKRWYGSFAIRFNLRKLFWEIAWVKFQGFGPERRQWVEIVRQDRINVRNIMKKKFTEHPLPLSVPIEKFLSDYSKAIKPPTHDVTKPYLIDASLF